MGKVSINVNGRAFAVGCEDGEEQAVAELGQHFDQTVSELAKQVGQIGDLRLFLMAALVLADKLRESEQNCLALKARVGDAEVQGSNDARLGADAAQKATEALNTAAKRIENLAQSLGRA
jgi:cell division protein ZapA